MWRDWEGHLGVVDPDGLARLITTGNLILCTTGYDGAVVMALWDELGVPYEWLDTPELRRRFPGLDAGRYYPPKRIDDPAFADDADGELTAILQPDSGYVDDPMLAARNLAHAARANGATFRFRQAVVEIGRRAGRVTGVRLAGGEELAAPVVVNVGGPHSGIINRMAGVDDEMRIGHRPLRQEVFALPAPGGFGLDDGGPVVADLDLGQYFRPQAGGTLLVGGTEPDCDVLEWVDDPDHFVDHPTVEHWETYDAAPGPPAARARCAAPARRVGRAVRRVRRLGPDLRHVEPRRLLHGLRDERQPVQERPAGRPVRHGRSSTPRTPAWTTTRSRCSSPGRRPGAPSTSPRSPAAAVRR